MNDLCRLNLAQMARSTNDEPNGMNCDNNRPKASSRVPLHVAYSGRFGNASSVMDDLCPVNLAQMACTCRAALATNQTA